MKVTKGLFVLLILSAAAWGSPIGSSARTAIPSDVQQIIAVDYRTLRNSDTAMALKEQVLKQNLKDFEEALKGIGINPEKDVDVLTFAAYRKGKEGVKIVGAAQGSFSEKTVLKKIKLNKIKPLKYHDS